MKINCCSVSFGYTTVLSKLFKSGMLTNVTKGFYGGELSIDPKSLQRASNEHLMPKSKGGQTALRNIVLATVENNAKRGNSMLSDYFQKEKADEFWEQFEDLIVEYKKGNKTKVFDGNRYIEETKETVRKILEQEKRVDLWG